MNVYRVHIDHRQISMCPSTCLCPSFKGILYLCHSVKKGNSLLRDKTSQTKSSVKTKIRTVAAKSGLDLPDHITGLAKPI
jgi:hypothetical protein